MSHYDDFEDREHERTKTANKFLDGLTDEQLASFYLNMKINRLKDEIKDLQRKLKNYTLLTQKLPDPPETSKRVYIDDIDKNYLQHSRIRRFL